jgi:hypothetical protein
MRRLLCVLVLCGGLFVPSSGGASPDRHAASTIVINTIQRSTAFAAVDADHNGKPSVGDYSVAQVVHLSPKTGKVIGGGSAICTQINAGGSLFDCQGQDHFAGGELREAGRFTISKGFRLAILGGTGIYQGASGELNGTWLDKKLTRSRDVFTIHKS